MITTAKFIRYEVSNNYSYPVCKIKTSNGNIEVISTKPTTWNNLKENNSVVIEYFNADYTDFIITEHYNPTKYIIYSIIAVLIVFGIWYFTMKFGGPPQIPSKFGG